MRSETFKAENIDELIWLRLNRLKSIKLCENLIRRKLSKTPNPLITDEIIKLNHYLNFQPLWEVENLRKGNRWSG